MEYKRLRPFGVTDTRARALRDFDSKIVCSSRHRRLDRGERGRERDREREGSKHHNSWMMRSMETSESLESRVEAFMGSTLAAALSMVCSLLAPSPGMSCNLEYIRIRSSGRWVRLPIEASGRLSDATLQSCSRTSTSHDVEIVSSSPRCRQMTI
jgi:hypothetical protein